MTSASANLARLFRAPTRIARQPLTRAFTLVELLVSIAVLSLALSTVALVFRVTTDTTSQAAAFAEATGWLRQFAQQLKQDLEGVNPAESILVVRGRTVPASINADGLQRNSERFYRVQTGNPSLVAPGTFDPVRDSVIPNTATGNQYSDPRADLLMFITSRAAQSQAPPGGNAVGLAPNTNEFSALRSGASFAPVLVAYGHAALARAIDQGNGAWTVENSTSWRHINQTRVVTGGGTISPLPIQDWRLARRQTLLLNAPQTPDAPPYFPTAAWTRDNGTNNGPALALNLSGFGNSGWAVGGDAIMFDFASFLALYRVGPPFLPAPHPALVNPYLGADGNAFSTAAANDAWRSLLYVNPNAPDSPANPRFFAALIPNPPPALRTNAAMQALPACAWFQVEYLMPEDPRNSPHFFDPSPGNPTDGANRFDPPNWASTIAGTTTLFVPDTPEARNRLASEAGTASAAAQPRGWLAFGRFPDPLNGSINIPPDNPALAIGPEFRRLRTWPYAIRVTVRVFDPRGRLSEPLVRTVVHRFD